MLAKTDEHSVCKLIHCPYFFLSQNYMAQETAFQDSIKILKNFIIEIHQHYSEFSHTLPHRLLFAPYYLILKVVLNFIPRWAVIENRFL